MNSHGYINQNVILYQGKANKYFFNCKKNPLNYTSLNLK